MWAVEKDPALRSDFCNLTILDRPPDDERMRRDAASARSRAIPRLGQRVVGAPLRLVPPEFADDPTLDLDAHMRVVAVPPPGDERALLDLCGALAEQPLDRARPLWEFTLIDGLAGGGAAVLQKVHHTITDGVGALRLSLALVDFERDPELDRSTPAPPPISIRRRDTPLGVTRQAVSDAAANGLGVVRGAIGGAGHVARPPGRAAGPGRRRRSLRRLAPTAGARHRPARSDVMTARSLRRHFEVLRPLARPRCTASAAQPRRQPQRRVRHRPRVRARPLSRAARLRRRRAAARDAGEHARRRRPRDHERVRAGAGPRSDPARARSRRAVQGRARTAAGREGRDRAGGGRRPRGDRVRPADVVARDR